MHTLKIIKPYKNLKGTINLPASKSESNRLMIIKHLSNEKISVENLSGADDIKILSQALSKINNSKNNDDTICKINVSDSGTAMRFLCALLSVTPGKWLLTGSERMKQRPLKPLVDALKILNADINYTEKTGFPPILIKGKKLKNNKTEILSNVSSQYISALLLIAPALDNGLILKLKGKIISESYISMTLKILDTFGIKTQKTQDEIIIKKQNYKAKTYKIESDWTAASYWFEMACLADDVDIFLKGLKKNSFQGDSILVEIYKNFGVKSVFENNGLRLLKTNIKKPDFFNFNFISNPDIAQTIAATCIGMNINAELTGLNNLYIKETNRLLALKNEFDKLKSETEIINNKKFIIKKSENTEIKNIIFDTYNDHRMAMCLAPLAICFNEININNPDVVKKSYPKFWDDLEKIGFELTIK